MSSYPYSPPEIPIRSDDLGHAGVLRDTGGAGAPDEGWPEDANLLDDLVEEVIGLVATWRPTTEWHLMSVVRPGRTAGVAGLAGGDVDRRGPGRRCTGPRRSSRSRSTSTRCRCTDARRRSWCPPRSRPRQGRCRRGPPRGRARRDRRLTAGERAKLQRWTSLAQWVGTERGIASIDRVEEAWPGYGDVAARSILNAYYTDPHVIETVWSWLADQGVTDGRRVRAGLRPRGLDDARAARGIGVRRGRHRSDLGDASPGR